jgi:hypothetical protein
MVPITTGGLVAGAGMVTVATGAFSVGVEVAFGSAGIGVRVGNRVTVGRKVGVGTAVSTTASGAASSLTMVGTAVSLLVVELKLQANAGNNNNTHNIILMVVFGTETVPLLEKFARCFIILRRNKGQICSILQLIMIRESLICKAIDRLR